MTARNSQVVDTEIQEFYKWVDDQKFVEGYRFDRVLVTFCYTEPRFPRKADLSLRDRNRQITEFYNGQRPGHVVVNMETLNCHTTELTNELLNKIDGATQRIGTKARNTLIPLFKERVAFGIQEEVSRGRKMMEAMDQCDDVNCF